jgi:hypothetical protein
VVAHKFALGLTKGTMFAEVYFTEGNPDDGEALGACVARSNVQNTNLETLKAELARQVKSLGGNVLGQFEYVQRASIFSFSSVAWEAKGIATKVAPELISQVVQDAIGSTKLCPFCGEEIKTIAIKCKHCGSDLGENAEQESLKETAYLLRNPANARRLLGSIERLESGLGTVHDLPE